MKSEFLLEIGRDNDTISPKFQGTSLSLLGEVVMSLAKDKMIVGYDESLPHFESLCAYVREYSLPHRIYSNNSIVFQLLDCRHIVNCVELLDWSDLVTLRIIDKKPIEEVEIPIIKKTLLFKDDISWFESRLDQYYALCYLTKTQMLALQIKTNKVNYRDLGKLVNNCIFKYSTGIKECKTHIALRYDTDCGSN